MNQYCLKCEDQHNSTSASCSCECHPVVEAAESTETTTRVVDGKVYNIHMPSDPAEDNMCDGCQ